MMKDKEIFNYEDLKIIYKKYYITVGKVKEFANIRFWTTIKKYINKFDISVISLYEDKNEIYLDKSNYDKIENILKNRYLYFTNQCEPVRFSEYLIKSIPFSRHKVNNLVKEKKIFPYTIIKNKYLFLKKDLDFIIDYYNDIYLISEVRDIIIKNTNITNLSIDTVRVVSNKLNITFENKYSYNQMFIYKKDLNIVIDYFKEKYKRHIKYEKESYIEKYLKTKIVYVDEKDLFNYYDLEYLKESYYDYKFYKGYHKKVKSYDFKVIYINIINKIGLNLNISKDNKNFYLLKSDFEKFTSYLYENIIKEEELYKYYSQEEIIEVLNKNYIRNVLKNMKFKVYGNKKYYYKDDIDNIVKYQENHTSINSICRSFDITRKEIYILLKNLNIEVKKSKSLFDSNVISNEFLGILEKEVTYKKKIKNANNKYEELIIEIERLGENNNIKKTNEIFKDYIIERFKSNSKVKPKLLYLYSTIILRLKKEIMLHSDIEIETLITLISQKTYLNEFLIFLNYCKEYGTKFTGNYKVEKKFNKIEGYTEEQWVKFGELLFCDELDYYKISLNKAIENKKYAQIWLYCSLNYILPWRCEDILNIPSPDIEVLGIKEDHYLDILKKGLFTKNMAQLIINNLYTKISMIDLKANKNNQKLQFIISESYVFTIGLLMYLCEVHRRLLKNRKQKVLINKKIIFNRELYIEFFGDEFNNIFGNENFSNMKSTKTIANMTQKISQNNGWGNGYYLVAAQRGHKINDRGIPKITQVYLESLNKDKNIDKISENLFERGTFGFIKYQLLQFLNKDNEEFKKIETQTKQILSYRELTPYFIENLIEYHYKLKQSLLINRLNNCEFNKENLSKIILNLSEGQAPAKNEHSQCFLKLINEKCEFTSKTSCIGCQYLIPELYFLIEFNKELFLIIEKYKESKNNFERKKYMTILINNYIPLLSEAIKHLGKEKVSSFIDLVLLKEEIKLLYEVKDINYI